MYECHITVVNVPDHTSYKKIAAEFGWKTSCIDGDPLLGDDKKFFYFTRHDESCYNLYLQMKRLSHLLGVGTVVREKIEKIVYDTKTGAFDREAFKNVFISKQTVEGSKEFRMGTVDPFG